MTYRFIRDVSFCERNSEWFKPNKLTVDMIMGYDSINQTLYERNCVNTPDCPRCPRIVESVEHMLFECPLYDSARNHGIFDQRTDGTLMRFLEDRENFELFYIYATEVFRRRKLFIRIENDRQPTSAWLGTGNV